MNNIEKIINLKLHPINKSLKYISECKTKLKRDSILQLDNFLLNQSLKNIQNEATSLHKNAYYCKQKHTVLLEKKNYDLSENDPCNIEVKSDKGCVPHDLIPTSSDLQTLYNALIFKNFLKKILEVKEIHPYKDPLSSINYNYYEENQELGWHFDNASFAITLMVQTAESGGVFEFIDNGRNFEKKTINKKIINLALNYIYPVQQLSVNPGTLILFYGRNYLHRVTPVQSKKSRILVTLNYNLEKNIVLSENARLTFFGRVK
tara:strand:+ start:815 stop:1600 length:786 start_codon:yes stop_codon:yes gene_type:complete